MRLFLIFILTICNFFSSAQSVTDTIITDIKNALQKKQISALNDYIGVKQHHIFIRWQTLRDIVDNRQEGVLKIEIVRKPDSISNVDNFSINILADQDRIFYYELIKWIFKRKSEGDYESFPIVLDVYKDSTAYQKLGNLYTAVYHSPIDTTDLFKTSIVYGISCGITGAPTEYQEKLFSIIQHRDLATISSWLRSPNIEKQLYAIQGLITLEKSGYQLTSEDNSLIKAISQKKGLVNTCSGCIYSTDSIKNVFAEITPYSLTTKKNKTIWLYYGLATLALIVSLLLFYRNYKRNKGSVEYEL